MTTTTVVRSRPPGSREAKQPAVGGGLLLVGVLVGAVGLVTDWPYDTSGAFVVAPVLMAATIPIIRRIAREDDEPWLGRLLVAALLLKFVASVVRYLVAFEVYGGVADSVLYTSRAENLAPVLRSGSFDIDVDFPIPGTGFPVLLTTMVYAIIGPTKLGGFLVFAWLGYLGQVLAQRAFRVGFPAGDARRYSFAVLLLPSLLFWPSSIGKESWVLVTLGLAAYGAARVFARRRGGYLLMALGLVGLALVRPHVSVLVAASLLVAYLRRRADVARRPSLAVQVAGLAVLVLGGSLLLRQTQEYFGVNELSVGGATEVFDETARRTAVGGSEFEAAPARSLADVPAAVATVMFRPLPFEATNTQMRIASLEGVVLLAAFAVSLRRLGRLPRVALREPYVAFAAVYSLMFAVAFSNFGNFGLLARQRVQLLPFALVFIALPPPESRGSARLTRRSR